MCLVPEDHEVRFQGKLALDHEVRFRGELVLDHEVRFLGELVLDHEVRFRGKLVLDRDVHITLDSGKVFSEVGGFVVLSPEEEVAEESSMK